jgi:excinuclease ABC subunit A
VRGWDRRNAYYFTLIQSLGRHFKFDVEIPWRDLEPRIQNILLYGSNDEAVEFRYFDGRGGTNRKKHPFEGILPNLERRYKDTDSMMVREELAKYLGSRACTDCKGTRLNVAARHVFIKDRNIASITALSVGRALALFKELELAGWRGAIAVKIKKEIVDRLERHKAEVAIERGAGYHDPEFAIEQDQRRFGGNDQREGQRAGRSGPVCQNVRGELAFARLFHISGL